jgi:hypothetical protein
VDRFSKNTQISKTINTHPMRAELFHEDRRTDRLTDIKKLIVAFVDIANAPKMCIDRHVKYPLFLSDFNETCLF